MSKIEVKIEDGKFWIHTADGKWVDITKDRRMITMIFGGVDD